MSLEFDVSFQKAVAGVEEFQTRLSNLSRELDRKEKAGRQVSNAYRDLFQYAERFAKGAEKSLESLTGSQATAGKLAEEMRRTIERTGDTISRSYLQASTRAAALRDNVGSLKNVILDTKAEQNYARTYERIALLQQEGANKAALLRAQLEQLRSAQASELAALQAQIRAQQEYNRVTSESYRLDQQAQYARQRNADEATQADKRRRQELTQLRNAIEERAKAEQKAAAEESRASRQYAENARVSQDATRKITEAEARMRATRAQVLSGTEAYNQALQRNAQHSLEAGRSAEIYANQLQRISGVAGSASAEKLNQQLAQLAAKGREATSSLSVMSKQQAETSVQEERLVAALERRNKLTLEQARANQVLSASEARLAESTRRQTDELKRRSQYAQMTNMQLLGMSRGVDKLSKDMHINAQAAAMFRAGLGGMNASIGIYTSSTVLAASATYAFAAALRNTVTVGMEFTETMSRAEAVMMTGTDAVTTAGRSMEGLEMQVRALGSSTIFTATEVSSGLVDLGMAGLSANQALTALKPALDLASIGGIQMSESADIATNVMTAFKLQASDLTDVVDILATAVTNSNTTISQLANALSYVGPAAQAAGFDLKDTVSAIELLSNAGIKASKAGTGLRRFMLNIQNPTSKGAAVLKKYGIALDDAEGNTRSLMDILGQFNSALHKDGITPAQRMADIVDLVGVRAASAVSRMVGSTEELGVLRRQLDAAGGAAEEMRQKIEDNLTADWRQVKSSFQELQLEVFGEFEWHLRTLSAELTNFFRSLTIEGEDGISRLDELIASAHKGIDVFTGLAAAFIAFKGMSVTTTMLGALASKTDHFSDRMDVLSTRMANNTKVSTTWQTAMGAGTLGLKQKSTAANVASASMSRLTLEMSLFSKMASYAATAARGVAAALGWAGVVYGIYTAITTAFGSTQSYLEDHEERVGSLKERYKELETAIQSTQLGQSRQALGTQIEEQKKELEGLRELYATYQEEAMHAAGTGAEQPVNDRLFTLGQQINSAEKALAQLQERLDNLGHAQGDVATRRADLDGLVKDTQELRDQIEALESQPNRTIGEMLKLDNLRRQVAENVDKMEELKVSIQETAATARTFALEFAEAMERTRGEIFEEDRFEDLSTLEKIQETRTKLAGIRAQVLAMDMGPESAKSSSLYSWLEEQGAKLMEQLAELELQMGDNRTTYLEAHQEMVEGRMTEAEKARQAKAELVGLNAELFVMQSLARSGAEVSFERMAEIVKQIRENQATVDSYEESQAKEAERRATEAQRAADRAAKEQERRMEQAMSAYQSIADEMDPVAAATREFNDTQKQMQSLLDAGRISAEDYADAMAHLRLRLHETTLEHNKHYQALQSLREEYLTSPFEATLDDLVKLNQLLDEGAVSMREYERLSERMKEKQREDAISGMPQPDIGGLPDSASTPFGEYISAVSDHSEGLSQYQDRASELDSGYALEQERIQRETEQRIAAMEAEVQDREEHARRLAEIKQREKDSLLAAEQKYNTQSAALMQERAQYAEASAKMVEIAMVGSLSNAFGMIAKVGEDATTAQKVAFAAQKALTVAQILMYTHLAAARAPAEAGPILGIPLSTMIMAQGYASAGLVGGLAIGQLSGAYEGGSSGGGGGGGGGSFAGMYDKGGQIPAGQFGIVGEYGPEIVRGPANVTSRKDTARQLGRGGDHIEFKPVIQVTVEGGSQGNDQNPEETGRLVGKQVEAQVMQLFHREMRPNGVLDRWKRS